MTSARTLRALLFWVCGALPLAAAPGIQLDVGTRDVEEALRLARASEMERTRFHAAYTVPVTDASLERLDVVTEYRRMVILAEERAILGTWSWLTRDAEAALEPWKRIVAIRARVRFGPLKVYPQVPAIDVIVGQGEAGALRPTTLRHQALYGLAGTAESGGPLVGAAVEALFDAAAIGQRRLKVTVRGPDPPELVSAVDFGRLR